MSARSPQTTTLTPRHLAILSILLLLGISTVSQYFSEKSGQADVHQPVATQETPATDSHGPISRATESANSTALPESESVSEPPTSSPTPEARSVRVIVARQTIRDQSGRILYQGDIDLTDTLDRIERGERYPHRNDGGTFRNLEKRLPRQPVGYYKEYVHPTPDSDGPGPQRVVLGQQGEIYYTPDHYQSFQRIER